MQSYDVAWLRFANAELSPRAAHAVLDRYATPAEVFAAPEHELADIPELAGDPLARLISASCEPSEAQLQAFKRLDISIVARDSPAYPPLLRDLSDRPPVLFVRGRLDERDRFAVGIVGTRRPSPYGREIAAMLSRDLTEMGFSIVSGGAMGIDTVAHHAAVRAGGRTIVVLGCGIDIPYPSLNQTLFSEIVEQDLGAIVSEFPLGATPEPWRFPARNRVISGLSMGTVVVEAGQQSGALITAGAAGDQGREVMAVPGNIDRPCSIGANALIRDGAALVTCAQDVVAALGVYVQQSPVERPQPARDLNLSDVQRRLLEHISLTPKHIDTLADEVGLPTPETAAQLTLLELAGHVHRQPGSCFIRAL